MPKTNTIFALVLVVHANFINIGNKSFEIKLKPADHCIAYDCIAYYAYYAHA